MSYRKMEAMLVEKVRQLRDIEAGLMRSYAEVQCESLQRHDRSSEFGL